MNMKKAYTNPAWGLIALTDVDVLHTSGEGNQVIEFSPDYLITTP